MPKFARIQSPPECSGMYLKSVTGLYKSEWENLAQKLTDPEFSLPAELSKTRGFCYEVIQHHSNMDVNVVLE
jgi:hypothetical protein